MMFGLSNKVWRFADRHGCLAREVEGLHICKFLAYC